MIKTKSKLAPAERDSRIKDQKTKLGPERSFYEAPRTPSEKAEPGDLHRSVLFDPQA